ncbi:MAG: hypothetical protein WBB01_25330 [Phormidesmis sp.]
MSNHLLNRPTVNIQEFESQYQESVGKILNELQSMAIISNRLESNIVEVGASVRSLNQMVETFLKQQREADGPSDRTLGGE